MFDTVSRLPGTRVQQHQQVVLLDACGRPAGVADKSTVHDRRTPLHLAFSCYVVRGDEVLLTRRSSRKRTWPGVWSNACCGHPRPGETLRQAVTRHLGDELGVTPTNLGLAFGDFAYRAEMPDGTVEHELCPVVVAQISGTVRPDPAEADAWRWLPWRTLVTRAYVAPETLSPWSVEQVYRFASEAVSPAARLVPGDPADALLDASPWGCTRPPAPHTEQLDAGLRG